MTGTVRVGIASATTTLWFDGSAGWEVPYRNGIQARYGEELALEIQLVTRGSPSEIRSQLVQLRSLVRTIDRGGGTFLVDDGSAVETYAVRSAQLQDVSERLPLWPAGFAEVRLLLTCDAESVSSTPRTLLEQFVTGTGQPVVVDPGGPAVLGLRVAPYNEPLPSAIEAYAIDGQYTAGDLVVPLSEQQYDDGTYTYSGIYTPPAPEVDVYAEVSGPVAAPVLAVTGAQAIPPYRRLVALTEPPATIVGDWQENDVFIVVSKRRRQPGWTHDGGLVHAQQLSSATSSLPLPPSHMVIGLRGATLLGVLYRRSWETQNTWPSNGVLTHSITVTLPSLPSGYQYVVFALWGGSWHVVNTGGIVNPWGIPNVTVSGLRQTGYSLVWAYQPFTELIGTSSSITFSWRAELKEKPDTFVYIAKSISADIAVCAVPSSLFSTLAAGDYRVAIVGYQGSEPVTVVHYERFVRVTSGYRLRVDFDSRDPALTYKVFIQRVGTTQWYSTSASPPSVTLSAPGTAESLPSVVGSGIRETIAVATKPMGVEYPLQEQSAAYVAGGRKLVPVGRLSFHSGEQYTVRVTSRHPVYRLWALPRPRVAVAGAYVIGSALLESVREWGRQVVRVTSAADTRAEVTMNSSYTQPWLMLSVSNYPAAARYILATLADGSGFVTPYTSASPLIVTHPVVNIPLVAVEVRTSRVPIAYYHESTGLASGRTIGAAVYLYNASTTDRTVTVYLEDSRTSGWQEQSATITVPAGSYAYQYLELTLNASVSAAAVSLSASSSTIIYANVIWVEGGWVTGAVRQSFYEIDWQSIDTFPYAGPRFFGWNITQKYIDASYPDTSHWPGTFSISISSNTSNGTYTYTIVQNRFLVRQGRRYRWDYSISNPPSGYTYELLLVYPGGTAINGGSFIPSSDGTCDFKVRITKNASTSATATGSFSSLRRDIGTNELGQLWGPGANALRLGWPQSASSWLIATRIVYRHDAVAGRFMRITLASGDPLDLEFSDTNIVAKRGSTTLLTLARPSTSPTTLRVSYDSGALTLSVGQPGSWSSVSTNVSLPAVHGMVELDGSQTRGEWGVRWIGLVTGPSSAMLAGTHTLLGSNDGAYGAFLNEASYAYWWAEEPYYVYRPGNIVLGAQRGVLEVSGKCTLVVFPISSIETRDIVDRAFVLDVLGYEKR
jgi:hypothetical protein